MNDHDDDNDPSLFRQAVGEVRPVRHDRVVSDTPKPPPRARQLEADERRVLEDMLSEDYSAVELQAGDALEFSRPGLQKRVLRKLRCGEYRISAELDLHGMTVPTARQALGTFLHEAREHDERCVRIIHGKGLGSQERGPVIKSLVNTWLRQRNEVLAFCSARPGDGGTGAVYVLLKA